MCDYCGGPRAPRPGYGRQGNWDSGRRGDWPGKPMDDCRDDWPGRPVPDGEMEGFGAPEFGFRRQFISRAEMLEALNNYLEELENEAEGVREAIDELLDEMMECGDIEEDCEEECCEEGCDCSKED